MKEKSNWLVIVRCQKCERFLGKLKGAAEIKCPKCKKVNHFRK